jgi:hypothetical protein
MGKPWKENPPFGPLLCSVRKRTLEEGGVKSGLSGDRPRSAHQTLPMACPLTGHFKLYP